MKLATIFAGTAVASLAMFADIGAPLGTFTIPSAQAQASVSFSIFYNDLADHGDWVRHRNEYVFIPANVQRGWRPYTQGHWVYANDYGWTWASDEPFGWATYHYGRWGYGDDIGWYWVPGTRWAPAWVSWRRSNDHVVWAPLPPTGGTDVTVEISVGDIPDFYWVAVPTRSFLEINLGGIIIDNDRDRRRIVERTEYIGTPRVQNNIVVNTVIDIDIIQKETGRKVRRVDVRKSKNPREARASDDQVTVFEGEVQGEANVKPKRVKKVEEVKRVTRQKAPAGEATPETATDVTTEQPVPGQAEDVTNIKKKKNQPAQAETETDTGVTTGEPAAGQADETATKKKRKLPSQAETPSANTETGTEAQVDAPAAEKKVKKAKANADAETDVQQPVEQAAQPQKKKKQNAGDDDVTTGTTEKAKKADKSEKGKKKQECDPDTDQNCPAQ